MAFFKNLLTFGAHGRIERKMEEFEDLKVQYESLYYEMDSKRKDVNKTLEKVIRFKVEAVKSLQKINKVSKNLKSKDREFIYRNIGNEHQTVNFKQIEDTITAGQIAMSATKGLSAGVGTALGAWALVTTFGSASTGAAIAGLSGVAATNAAFAWFGGGAIAAGGGGIAAGTAVLGGIVAIPALAVFGVFSHISANKKINEIEREMGQIIRYMDDMQANIFKMEVIEARSNELIISIDKAQSVFEQELKRTLRELNRIFILSKFIRWARKNIFRRNYYSESDLKHIAYIGGIAADFAVVIDTPVFEE
ncbi:hypothetical protein J4772_19265 [Cohnella sp. LGH]|uniref:hypothetical protein n=1 Tax=Cohnella sp. LGH TaxID=1619153 RepID=UPI001ADB17FB|nr:hypothetical protein [Cohnella sp. LGH]QTH39781.1 hypothetical protein J4772_19265 [Cohnella sp. LGH]